MYHRFGRGMGLSLFQALLLSGAIIFAGLSISTRADDSPVFHIGFSAATFGEVNENDAVAAVRIWAQTLAKERGIPADPAPKVLRGLTEITSALRNATVDCLDLTTDEYFVLRDAVPMRDCVVAVKSKSISEEYLLLVHQDSGIENLSQLRGRKISLLHSSRASLVPFWLDTLLAREGFGRAATFCGQLSSAQQISKVVLPLFFRQLDACVTTRSGFETMAELNPQVGRKLHPIATSPPLVPVFFCFRADYTSPIRDKILDEIERWDKTPAGKQILTLFQSDTLERRPFSCLDSSLALLAEYRQLCASTNSVDDLTLHAPGSAKSASVQARE